MKRVFLSLSLMAFLGACATPYQPVPFDRTSSKVSDIKIVEDALPAEMGIRKLATNGQNIASAASGLGLAGLAVGMVAAGVEAGIAAKQRDRIRTALATQKFDAEAIFDEALEAALKEQNYNLSTTNIAREENRDFVVVKAEADSPPQSAVLDIAGSGYGFQLVGGNTQWRPFATFKIKMVDAKDPAKVLLDNRIEYNAVAPVPLTVSIPGDPQFGFASIEEIEGNPAKAAEGLKAAITASAQATAKLLK